MDSTRDYALLADAKRTAAAEMRRIAKTVHVSADRAILISHAAWLESEAVALEKKVVAGFEQRAPAWMIA
jgi:hypothetical protein